MVAVADGATLLALRPDWTRLAHDLAAPHRWLDRVGTDQAALTLATAALWCVALWLAIGIGAVMAAALPGRGGAAARRIAARALPAVLLRAVAGVAGLADQPTRRTHRLADQQPAGQAAADDNSPDTPAGWAQPAQLGRRPSWSSWLGRSRRRRSTRARGPRRAGRLAVADRRAAPRAQSVRGADR